MLKIFWENHDPTQGMRQGNDVGTQYRSAIYTMSPEQKRAAEASRAAYQERLTAAGFGRITTEIADAPPFYYAEDYHQQYLAKNPDGYCGHRRHGRQLPGRRQCLTYNSSLMSRVIYTNTPATAARNRCAGRTRSVSSLDAEEGQGVNALPGGVYGFTYSPGARQRAALRHAALPQLRDAQARERRGVRDRVRERRGCRAAGDAPARRSRS